MTLKETLYNGFKFIKNNKKYTLIVLSTLLYFSLYIKFLFDPTKMLNNYFENKYDKYKNLLNLIIVLGFFILLLTVMFKTNNIILQENNFKTQFQKSSEYIGLITALFIFISSFFYFLVNFNYLASILIVILNLFIFGLFYKYVLRKYFLNSKLGTFLEKTLFSIPLYVINQYNLTSSTTFKLLLAEVVLLLLYFLIPFIRSKIVTRKGKLLLNDAVYTTSKHSLATHQELNNGDKYNYHYSVSAWFFMHERPPNTGINYSKYTEILNYGNKPKILFNPLKQKIKIIMQNDRNKLKTIYTGRLKLQKWNNIVITYDRGTLDVFINNILVASENNIVPYMTYDTLSVGSIQGVDGGVANVMYYPKILPLSIIKQNYRIFKRDPIV